MISHHIEEHQAVLLLLSYMPNQKKQKSSKMFGFVALHTHNRPVISLGFTNTNCQKRET